MSRRLRSLGWIAVALVLACSEDDADDGGSPTGPSPGPAAGTLVVHVEREALGPEVGALVRVDPVGREGRTGADGEIGFDGLEPGEYTVRVEPDAGAPITRDVSLAPPFPFRLEVVLPEAAGSGNLAIEWDGRTRRWGEAVELKAVGAGSGTVEWRSLDDLYLGVPVVLGRGETLTTSALKPGRTRVEARRIEDGAITGRALVEVDVTYRESWNVTRLGLVAYPDQTVGDVWVDGDLAFLARRGAGGVSIVGLDGGVAEVGRYTEPGLFTQDVKVSRGLAVLSNESDEARVAVVLVDVSDPALPRRLGSIGPPEATRAHNVWIDGDVVYLADTGKERFASYDVSDPASPVPAGNLSNGGTPHDIHVRDGVAYGSVIFGDGTQGLLTAGAPDLARLAFRTWPGAFTHSSWLSADGRFLYVSDEIVNAPLRIYDVADPANPVLVSTFRPRLGAVPHNFQVRDGGLAFLSHYRHGVEVIDVSDPVNPRTVGFYDTHPGADEPVEGALAPAHEETEFEGAWGVHWTDDGRIVVSDMNRGVFVLRYTGPGGP